jgi:hypothetical protein
MLKSEAFCGQLIKITYGAYKGNVGIIYHTAPNAARVLLATKEAKKDWGSLYYVEYEDMESFYANTIPQVTPFDAKVTIDAKGNYHIEDASAPNTKYYDEHYASMAGLEPIELMQLVLSLPEFVGFLKGNIIKYTMRAGKKQGEAAEKDAAKAKRYIEWLIKLGYKMPINPKED